MRPKWVVETDIFDEGNLRDLLREIESQGMEYVLVSHNRAMKYDFWKNMCVLCYGSVGMMRAVGTEKNGWSPGSFFMTGNLKCSSYAPPWGEALLNDRAVYTTFPELRRNKDFFFSKMASPLGLFVRPDSSLKTFSGTVLDDVGFDKEIPYLEHVSREDLVLVAPAKSVEAEWRFVIAKRKVIAWSRYMNRGEISLSRDVDPGAMEMAEKMCFHQWQPDVVYVLDIAKAEGQYRVVEPNAFSSSDFYACDKKPIVEVAEELSGEEWEAVYGTIGDCGGANVG